MADHPYLSVIIPLYNEQEVFLSLLREVLAACNGLEHDFEIIFVDDGSKDNTSELIAAAVGANPKVKSIRLSRNFGHQAAFSAGIDFATGDMILTMDGDLQHPPALIPEFVRLAEQGNDIVVGERLSNKQNSVARELTGKLFYKLLSALTNLEFRNASDFALYNRNVVTALKRLPERERFLRGLVQWVGFQKKYLMYSVGERRAGVPKYTLKKQVKLVISALMSFSSFPLLLPFWMGMSVFALGLLGAVYFVTDRYLHPGSFLEGWAAVAILVMLVGGLQLMTVGIAGEYLYKMFNEIKGRPLYIVADTCNIDRKCIEQSRYGITSFH